MTAFVLIMFCQHSFAEDFEEFDDPAGDTEYSDVPEATETDIEKAKGTMDALSGYYVNDIPVEGDFRLEQLDAKIS